MKLQICINFLIACDLFNPTHTHTIAGTRTHSHPPKLWQDKAPARPGTVGPKSFPTRANITMSNAFRIFEISVKLRKSRAQEKEKKVFRVRENERMLKVKDKVKRAPFYEPFASCKVLLDIFLFIYVSHESYNVNGCVIKLLTFPTNIFSQNFLIIVNSNR